MLNVVCVNVAHWFARHPIENGGQCAQNSAQCAAHNLQKPLRGPRSPKTRLLVRGPRSAIGTVRALPPARARARRSLMADEDAPPTSALRSAWVDDPPFSAAVTAAECCCTKRSDRRSGRGCRRGHAAQGPSRRVCAAPSGGPAQGGAVGAPLHAQAL
jgi:hypothetical protein